MKRKRQRQMRLGPRLTTVPSTSNSLTQLDIRTNVAISIHNQNGTVQLRQIRLSQPLEWQTEQHLLFANQVV